MHNDGDTNEITLTFADDDALGSPWVAPPSRTRGHTHRRDRPRRRARVPPLGEGVDTTYADTRGEIEIVTMGGGAQRRADVAALLAIDRGEELAIATRRRSQAHGSDDRRALRLSV